MDDQIMSNIEQQSGLKADFVQYKMNTQGHVLDYREACCRSLGKS